MKILCDIGGTYVRFARYGKSAPESIEKYEVLDFENLPRALQAYCSSKGVAVGGELFIALAKFHNDSLDGFPWINTSGLKGEGWDVRLCLNDFEAAVMALPHLEKNEIHNFKSSPNLNETVCLIGPGTGLGLAYLRRQEVQLTCGGQMAAAGVTNEQREILAKIQSGLPALPYESLVSGGGLEAIYKACGGNSIAIEDFMKHLDDPHIQKTLGLFHEFFSLFAANVVIAGHAVGGLYLTGGVMAHLMEANAFDFSLFEETFLAHPNPLVRKLLEGVPISYISYPYPALKGLYHA